ncbi:MAG: hypothetical protein V3T72_14755 [Thermoanaerobaculia bacterium]
MRSTTVARISTSSPARLRITAALTALEPVSMPAVRCLLALSITSGVLRRRQGC